MSYAIIRNAKYKMSNLPSIGRHNERQNKDYGNPDIDTDRIKDNIYFKKPIENSYEKEFYRIREQEGLKGNLRLTGKKQSNVACEFLITSDNDFFSSKSLDETHSFFSDCYDFVKEKCKGEQNIISAVVHMDETTPHMHVTYIPVVEGKDRKGEPCKRVNSSEFWKGYNSYGQLQDEFHSFCIQKGHNLQRGEVGSRAENMKIADLKRQTINRELHELEQAAADRRRELGEIKQEMKLSKVKLLKRDVIQSLEPVKAFGGSVKGVTVEQVNSLKASALENIENREKVKRLEYENQELQQKIPSISEKMKDAEIISKLKYENVQLRQTVNELSWLHHLAVEHGLIEPENEQKAEKEQGHGFDMEL